MTYFIEQYRDIRHCESKIMQTPAPMPISYLESNLETTNKSQTLKTVAVWIIKPKKL